MLSLDWATIAFQIVNFLVLAALLYRFVFRPVMAQMRERAAERDRLRQELAEERDEAEKARAKLQERLDDAEEEADDIITEAHKQAEVERQEMLDEVEEDVERILSEARGDVRQMRRQAVEECHDELIEAILDISARVIHQAAPPEVHDALVGQLSKRIWEMGRSEMDRVRAFRRSLGERTPIAHVMAGRQLSSEQQGELARTLSALADRNVDIQLKVDPELAAGMRVRLGDFVVDNSIAGRVEDLREDASQALKEQLADE